MDKVTYGEVKLNKYNEITMININKATKNKFQNFDTR